VLVAVVDGELRLVTAVEGMLVDRVSLRVLDPAEILLVHVPVELELEPAA
jgi:hypothetical protein